MMLDQKIKKKNIHNEMKGSASKWKKKSYLLVVGSRIVMVPSPDGVFRRRWMAL